MTLHEDMDPNKAYGGIDRIWVLPADHPFNKAFEWHDQQFDLAREGQIVGKTSEAVDLTLLKQMLEMAGSDVRLRIEAYFYYDLCRLWGRYYWPQAAIDGAK